MTNLPAERSDATLALTGTQASLFDDDPARLLGLDDGEFAALVAQVRQRGDDLFTGIRKVVGLLAWAAWHRYDEKRYREFVADFAGRLGVESRVILDWRRKAATGLPMPPMAQARSDARKGAGQRPVNTPGRIIPAKSSEGVAPASETVREPVLTPPSGPSSGGADVQPPAGPTGEVPTSSPSAPPDSPVDVDAIGLRWLKSKTTREVRAIGDPWGPAIRAEIMRWTAAFGFSSSSRPGPVQAGSTGPVPIPPPRYDLKPPPRNGAKRHALDCSCLGCKPVKAVVK